MRLFLLLILLALASGCVAETRVRARSSHRCPYEVGAEVTFK